MIRMYKISSLIALLSLLFVSCSDNLSDYGRISGFTQGTTYSVVYGGMALHPVEKVRAGVEQLLTEIDNSLSVYNDSSVISRLNRNETDQADQHLEEVIRQSMLVSEKTGGAFDITVMPLVKAWGFGPDEQKSFDRSGIDSLLSIVGFRKITMEGRRMIKSNPMITIDVNAIAQGYTVDVICRMFDEIGVKNYLVEIGGEVRVKGKKAGKYWKIGIDRPSDSNFTPGSDLQAIIELPGRALATSGNYRKFYVEDGIKYSHTIDPRTGYPSKNRLLSATVIADNCATADAYATACMVKGLDESIEFISSEKNLEGYLVYSDDNGNFRTWISEGLKQYLSEQSQEVNAP